MDWNGCVQSTHSSVKMQVDQACFQTLQVELCHEHAYHYRACAEGFCGGSHIAKEEWNSLTHTHKCSSSGPLEIEEETSEKGNRNLNGTKVRKAKD